MTDRTSRPAREGNPLDGGSAAGVTEEVEVRGHIVDSLLLPKILDRILLMGGSFEIRECKIGVRRTDPSYARIAIRAEAQETLEAILGDLVEHGASPIHPEDATTVPADIAGAFPDGFYSTTSQPTQVRVNGRWVDVRDQEMDCGIVVESRKGKPRCIPMCRVVLGMPIVVGHAGVRVIPVERPREVSMFGFMSSAVSSEKPKSISVKSVVDAIRATRAEGKKVLLVGGPAIVHTGSAPQVARLIKEGWVQVLFAGNALATHDLEQSLYGTSLGVSLTLGEPIEHGHEHHLRTINTIRRLGGIEQAVRKGVITSGIMYECVQAGIDVVLAGSIRDDGPLPEVITDTLVAQDRMARGNPRRRLRALDRDRTPFDCHRQPAAGVGKGRECRYQPGDRDQAGRSGHLSDDRPGHRRRAVLALPRRRAVDVARRVRFDPVDVIVMGLPPPAVATLE